ncbi:MAG: Na/Pi cotransporter family protein [Lachnospiraceae bacterium]|nr:Na/Pi cotransporter family protein [Lachnospiraceae bacterium]
MDIFNILSLVGGLALFLYGMNLLGDCLEKLSGGKLERILERLTSKPIMAVILGAGVTAAIQSSSATTVMVVGFVNSGIMKLRQAVYIIMGANIGTTATSWILSLSGLEGDNFFIRMLKPSSFSPLLAFIGILFLMFSKKEKKHTIGGLLIGFAILMTGMDSMSAAVEPLKDVPGFADLFIMFSNPILGMLLGAVLTAIIQSSSASVGILQALCETGAVTYSSAIPIIMGQNIGTCVTALISAIGAKKNAKRAAFVHLYFNLLGTIVFMIIFYTLNSFIGFSFMGDAANKAGIAVIHTIFNVVATLLLFPFGRMLERLAYLTIRDSVKEKQEKTEEEKMKETFLLLDDRFLDVPGLATTHCRQLTSDMAELSKKAVFTSLDLLFDYDEEKAAQIVELENIVDRYEDELGAYMVKVSSKDLNEADSKTLSILLHSIGDFERISDHAVNIADAAKEVYDKKISFSEAAVAELRIYIKALQDILNIACEAFEKEDMRLAVKVEPIEEVIDSLNIEVKKRHINRLRNGVCTIEMGFVFSDVTTNFERIADHCSNLAVSIVQTKNDAAFESHIYLDQLKEENEVFKEKFEKYKERYALPHFDGEDLQ